jgi:hypothetical protein
MGEYKQLNYRLRPELYDEAMAFLDQLKYSKDPLYKDAYKLIEDNPTEPLTSLQKRLRNDTGQQLAITTWRKIAAKCKLPHNPN